MIRMCKSGTLLLVLITAFLLTSSEIVANNMCQFPSIPGQLTWADAECDPGNKSEWDYQSAPASDIQLPANGSLEVKVTGGKGPYTWEVSGTGYSFEGTGGLTETTSNDPNVTLSADGSACGVATVKVRDGCGHLGEIGYFRGPGSWVEIPDDCPIPGEANSGNNERIEGKYKVYQVYDTNGFISVGGCRPEGSFSCGDLGSYGDCYSKCENRDGGSGMGCVECIDFNCPSYAPHEGFPCCAQESCPDGTYTTIRCYATDAFTLYEWQCQ